MATTIGTVSPYKLGSPPDFGTLYSGRALEFDGVADYVDCGAQSSTWKNVGVLSLSGWFYIDAHKSTNGIMGKHQSDNESTGVTVTASNFTFMVANGGIKKGVCTAPTAGAWHHFVCVFNGGGTGNDGRMQV